MMQAIIEAAKTPQLIRGVVVAGFNRCGFLSCHPQDLETGKYGGNYAYAYTRYYRHDDDLTELDKELEALGHLYLKSNACDGLIYGVETKPYISSK